MGGGDKPDKERKIVKFCGIKIYQTTRNLGESYRLYKDSTIGKFALETPDIDEKILNLTRGLDRESKNTAIRIISRLIDCEKNNQGYADDLTSDEVKGMRSIQYEFYPNIRELSPSLFYYDGYFLPINFFLTEVMFDKHGLHKLESQTLAKMKNKDIIDVGGCLGDSALVFQSFTDKKIYTFEATKRNFALMQKTLELNGTTRIIPVNYGLGSKREKLKIYSTNDTNIGASSIGLGGRDGECEECEIITLDSYVRENGLEVGFIKVDIEGFEMEFIKGALETIKTQRPAMLISIYHQPSDFFDIKPLIESWNLGYTFKIYKPMQGGICGETALLCEVLE